MDNNPRRDVSGGRKAAYYAGMALTIIGLALFFSVFLTVALAFGGGDPFSGPLGPGGLFMRAVVGMALAMVGQALMRVGARGLAGSGVVLDPRRTREDLEPWTRAAGGMVSDALDEADVRLGGEGGELPFDEKLRRLEQLRKEGLLTEDEYQAKRKELLAGRW